MREKKMIRSVQNDMLNIKLCVCYRHDFDFLVYSTGDFYQAIFG